ncbi:restriction endonuclease subunit S [Prolixibacteraceae bacterium Z1-6]|uniref:Restriction endonuclease subunit S n=1 Tax=Draconibacterium aestuarii TaxID=2998507 RepID=A0A9X3FFD5_9BACT|nr:restriction endonuclease subunit S [Prolixibacteraceae bacterium Z1-6]
MVEEKKIAEGFQQTDAGIIPNDWVVKPLHEIAHFENGKAHEQFIDEHGDYIVVNSKFISTEGRVKKFSKRNIFPLKKGDITIVMSDIPKGKALAKCYLIEADDRYTLNQRIGGITANEDTDNKYLFYKLNRNKYYLAFDSGTGQTNIKRQEILDCPVALPSTKDEQENISSAIFDCNSLILELEKLLIKKRNIKKGAVQELLTPKPDWIEKELGKSAILKARIGWQGLTTAEYKDTGDYYLITGTEFHNGYIDWDNCHFVEYERYKQDKNIQVKEHDVLVTKDGTIGKVALIKNVPKPATLNSGVFVIRPIEDSFNPEFFYFILLSDVFLRFLSQLSAGSTINHLYQKDFVTFKFKVPKTIDEQESIAKILFDMDSEIEHLEKKLTKVKALKNGIMQDLLTGKKRLK